MTFRYAENDTHRCFNFFLYTVHMEVLVRLKQMRFTLSFDWVMEGGFMLIFCMYKLSVIVSRHMEKSV